MTTPAANAARVATTDRAPAPDVLRVGSMDAADIRAFLACHALEFVAVADGEAIPGSYWGDSEAGVIGSCVYARNDTPLHSLLHEACHLIVLAPERRARVHTDATDSDAEEDATCYLQILLADELPGIGRERIMADMDAWGYTFRLGSARAWFESDAEDARDWLEGRGLLGARVVAAKIGSVASTSASAFVPSLQPARG